MIQEYGEKKYGFMKYIAYIVDVGRSLSLTMYEVEELKQS